MARLTRAVLALLPVLAACGSAAHANADFGLAPLQHERFPSLDTALSGRVGSFLLVHAQQELGQTGPVPESMVGFARFEGRLIGADEAWVSLFRAPDDTVRVSKGHITAVWLSRPASSNEPALVGATVFGLTALGIMQVREPGDRPTAQTQVAIVSASALLGGLLGRALMGGIRRGEQLYPLRDR